MLMTYDVTEMRYMMFLSSGDASAFQTIHNTERTIKLNWPKQVNKEY